MKLRPLTMEDADKMLELKNYEETRRFAITSHDEIKKEDHYKWLEENLQYFQAIVDGEKMVGALRFKDFEVSIWIDRKFWRQGRATYILQHFCQRGVTAKIMDTNIGSMRAFIRAGFEPISHHKGPVSAYDYYYTFKKW